MPDSLINNNKRKGTTLSYDPFASSQDEAQAEAPAAAEAPKKAPAKKAAPKVTNVSTTSEGKVVLTLKGGAGFDAPWIVIHAEDLQDANDQVTGENGDLLVDTMTKLQGAATKFVELGGGSRSTGGGGGGGGRRGAPPQAKQPPADAPPKPGDDWVYKSGTSARGPWQAWMPPQHLKDVEKPVWF
ncbi:ribonucleoside reductase class II [Mycobacterium phage SWU2]|uniref:Uncharacterized protein n=1 Tax=Mycobacterium phage SWU2 TaxID=2077150 RepID=A0A2K9VI17_9CAUD|nr:ribonucleoside reductase class II [Mycobacterium phage SWU2]AUV62006.1 hypothetical protein JX_gp47 [Mycobacterium phage SWU2]